MVHRPAFDDDAVDVEGVLGRDHLVVHRIENHVRIAFEGVAEASASRLDVPEPIVAPEGMGRIGQTASVYWSGPGLMMFHEGVPG